MYNKYELEMIYEKINNALIEEKETSFWSLMMFKISTNKKFVLFNIEEILYFKQMTDKNFIIIFKSFNKLYILEVYLETITFISQVNEFLNVEINLFNTEFLNKNKEIKNFIGKDIKYLLSLIKKNKNNNKFKTYDINISNYIYILKFNMNILKLIKKSSYKKVKMKLSNDENILVDSIIYNLNFNMILK